jgi:hypothetical protein
MTKLSLKTRWLLKRIVNEELSGKTGEEQLEDKTPEHQEVANITKSASDLMDILDKFSEKMKDLSPDLVAALHPGFNELHTNVQNMVYNAKSYVTNQVNLKDKDTLSSTSDKVQKKNEKVNILKTDKK